MPGLNVPGYKPPEPERVIAPPTRKFTPYLVDLTMPSLRPGEYMGEGGAIISASNAEAAAQAQAKLQQAQASKQAEEASKEKARASNMDIWLAQLRSEKMAEDLHLAEKARIELAKADARPTPLRPKRGAIIFPERLKTTFQGEKASASVPNVQGAGPNLYYETGNKEEAPLPLTPQLSGSSATRAAAYGAAREEVKAEITQAKSAIGYTGTMLSTPSGREQYARTTKQELKADVAYARQNLGTTALGVGVVVGASMVAPLATTAIVAGSIARTAIRNPERATAGAIEALAGGAILKGAGRGVEALLPKGKMDTVFKTKTDVLDIKGGLYEGKASSTTTRGGEIIKTDLKNVISKQPSYGLESKFEIKSMGTQEVQKIPLIGRITANPRVKSVLDARISKLEPGQASKVGGKLADWSKPVFVSKTSIGVKAGASVSEKNALGIRLSDVSGKVKSGTSIKQFELFAGSKKMRQDTYRRPSTKVETYAIVTGPKSIQTPKTVIVSSRGVSTAGAVKQLSSLLKGGFSVATKTRIIERGGFDTATGAGIGIVKTPLPSKAPWADVSRAKKQSGTIAQITTKWEKDIAWGKALDFFKTNAKGSREVGIKLQSTVQKKPSSNVIAYLADTYSKKQAAPSKLPPIVEASVPSKVDIIQPSKEGLAAVSKLENVAWYDKPIEAEAMSAATIAAVGEAGLGSLRSGFKISAPVMRPVEKVTQQERQQQAVRLREREGVIGQRIAVIDVPSVRELPKASEFLVSGLIIGQRVGLTPRIAQIQQSRQITQQEQKIRQISEQGQQQRTTTRTSSSGLRIPGAPMLFGGVGLGGDSGVRAPRGWLPSFRKPKGKVSPLADYLSVNIAEAKTGRKALMQAPTASTKSKFMAEITKHPFTWKFNVASVKRKKKGGMKLL